MKLMDAVIEVRVGLVLVHGMFFVFLLICSILFYATLFYSISFRAATYLTSSLDAHGASWCGQEEEVPSAGPLRTAHEVEDDPTPLEQQIVQIE